MKKKNTLNKKRSRLVKTQMIIISVACAVLMLLPTSYANERMLKQTIQPMAQSHLVGADHVFGKDFRAFRKIPTYFPNNQKPLSVGNKYKLSEGWCVKTTPDGGCIVCGENEGCTQYSGIGGAVYDVLMIIKYDANGHEEWNNTWKGLGDTTYSFSVKQTTDGGYVVTGFTYPEIRWDKLPDVPTSHIFLVKTDTHGKILWTQTYPELPNSQGADVIQTSDGGYTILGVHGSDPDWSIIDLLIIKTNNQGTLLQYRTIHQQGFFLGSSSIIQTPDHSFLLWGNRIPVNNNSRCYPFMMKLKENLTNEWTRNYSLYHMTNVVGNGLPTSDGGYLIYGSVLLQNWNAYSFVLKTDSQGIEQWNATYTVQGNTRAISAVQTSDQGYILTGFTHYPDPLQSRGFFLKISTNGSVKWNTTFDFPDLPDDGVLTYSLDRTTDDGLFASGLVLYTGTILNWDGKAFVIRTDAQGHEQWRRTFQWSDAKKPGMVKIVKPTKAFYFENKPRIRFPTPYIFGWINVTVNATDNETGIDHIDFYLDNKLVDNASTGMIPYVWVWYKTTFGKHTIRAVAFDKEGNSASSDELTVHKYSTVIGFILYYYLTKK